MVKMVVVKQLFRHRNTYNEMRYKNTPFQEYEEYVNILKYNTYIRNYFLQRKVSWPRPSHNTKSSCLCGKHKPYSMHITYT